MHLRNDTWLSRSPIRLYPSIEMQSFLFLKIFSIVLYSLPASRVNTSPAQTMRMLVSQKGSTP